MCLWVYGVALGLKLVGDLGLWIDGLVLFRYGAWSVTGLLLVNSRREEFIQHLVYMTLDNLFILINTLSVCV